MQDARQAPSAVDPVDADSAELYTREALARYRRRRDERWPSTVNQESACAEEWSMGP